MDHPWSDEYRGERRSHGYVIDETRRRSIKAQEKRSQRRRRRSATDGRRSVN